MESVDDLQRRIKELGEWAPHAMNDSHLQLWLTASYANESLLLALWRYTVNMGLLYSGVELPPFQINEHFLFQRSHFFSSGSLRVVEMKWVVLLAVAVFPWHANGAACLYYVQGVAKLKEFADGIIKEKQELEARVAHYHQVFEDEKLKAEAMVSSTWMLIHEDSIKRLMSFVAICLISAASGQGTWNRAIARGTL